MSNVRRLERKQFHQNHYIQSSAATLNRMNQKQKAICICAILVVVGTAAYPPFILHGREGVVISLGYAWALVPPESGMLDTALLLTEWVGTLIVGVIALLLFKDRP